ncbi:unnamed protein product [Arctia plantaginis]|uniref:Regulatory protein zeste n=1 Tax=Arctia plantaginis TaxID=874455 RepID=A0A8S1A2U7_ARCPL|nr:unnamed protein product [Arctia plantaginis]
MGKIIKMNNNRRLRTPNWSFDEKQFLLELIKQRKDVVVTKSNNGPNHYEEKDIAWNEILNELSTRFGEKFSGSSTKKVKTQWQNMKRIAREEIALNGPMLQNYSRLSLEVCNIIELIKDGVLRSENENLNETSMTTNIEIKSEYVEDDVNQPSCSGVNVSSASMDVDNLQNKTNSTNLSSNQLESSTSSASEQVSDGNDYDIPHEDNSIDKCIAKRNASVMTDRCMDETSNIPNLLQRDLQNYFQYSAEEKQLKMDSLKEERQIIRAMRETAELNKIIAEQRLKHVLWVKKQEMLYVYFYIFNLI